MSYCLIPAAGQGKRMLPLTYRLPKVMLPVAGRPVIYHILDKVRLLGIKNFIIVTNYLKEFIESEVLLNYPDLNIKFVEQKEMKGLGHACFQGSRDIPRDSSLLIVYGDTLFEADLSKIINSNLVYIGASNTEDPSKFGIIELDSKGEFIKSFIEKPERPPTDLAIAGVNFFPKAGLFFDALEYIINNNFKTKGEYQVTDAYDYLVKKRKVLMKHFILDGWFDCGTPNALLKTNQVLLSKKKSFLRENFQNTEIIDPIYIGENCTIKNCKIGPYTSIGAETKIKNSKITNSIIENNCQITSSFLKDSFIGSKSKIKDFSGNLILSANCQVVG